MHTDTHKIVQGLFINTFAFEAESSLVADRQRAQLQMVATCASAMHKFFLHFMDFFNLKIILVLTMFHYPLDVSTLLHRYEGFFARATVKILPNGFRCIRIRACHLNGNVFRSMHTMCVGSLFISLLSLLLLSTALQFSP